MLHVNLASTRHQQMTEENALSILTFFGALSPKPSALIEQAALVEGSA